MNKDLVLGYAAGVMGVIGVQAVRKLYKSWKYGQPNAWELAFEKAEVTHYKRNWGGARCSTPSDEFKFIDQEMNLPPMRVFKTFTPNGTRALLITTLYSDVFAIYETSQNSRQYAACGCAPIMDRRFEGINVFSSIIPTSMLSIVCDPTSSIYQRDEFDAYYVLSPYDIHMAANNDECVKDFIDGIVNIVQADDFDPDKATFDYLPMLVRESFPHIELKFEMVDDKPQSELLVGERQIDKPIMEKLEDQLESEKGKNLRTPLGNGTTITRDIAEHVAAELGDPELADRLCPKGE